MSYFPSDEAEIGALAMLDVLIELFSKCTAETIKPSDLVALLSQLRDRPDLFEHHEKYDKIVRWVAAVKNYN